MEEYNVNEIIMYLRKSRADSDNETVEEVLTRHETILQEYALKTFGHIIPAANIYKEVASGETIDSRPEIKKVLALTANETKYRAVLVVEPQRLTRGDMLDCGTLIRVFKYNNIKIITPSKTFDLQDQYDLKYFQMTLQQGNEYLEYIKFILNRGRIASVKEGCFIGQHAPYGYDKAKKGKQFTLVPNEQADVVRLMFDLYVNNDMGCNQIASELDRRGIKPQYNEYWSAASIREMLRNPTYIGKIRWNYKKTVVTTDEFGNATKKRPRGTSDDVIIVDGLHDAIIDEEIFKAAQAKSGRNARTPGNRQIRNPYATLLKCGTCGRAMSYRTYKDTNGKQRGDARMLCVNQVHCHTPSVSYREFENAVIASLKLCLSDFKFKLNSDDGGSSALQQSILKTLKKELDSLESQQTKLYDFLERGIYNEEVFLKRNTALNSRRSQLIKAIAVQEQAVPEAISYEDKIYKLSQAIEILQNDDVPAADKNKFLKSFVKRIDYYNDLPSKGNRFIENSFKLEITFL